MRLDLGLDEALEVVAPDVLLQVPQHLLVEPVLHRHLDAQGQAFVAQHIEAEGLLLQAKVIDDHLVPRRNHVQAFAPGAGGHRASGDGPEHDTLGARRDHDEHALPQVADREEEQDQQGVDDELDPGQPVQDPLAPGSAGVVGRHSSVRSGEVARCRGHDWLPRGCLGGLCFLGPEMSATSAPPTGVNTMPRMSASQKPIRRVLPSNPTVITRITGKMIMKNGIEVIAAPPD